MSVTHERVRQVDANAFAQLLRAAPSQSSGTLTSGLRVPRGPRDDPVPLAARASFDQT